MANISLAYVKPLIPKKLSGRHAQYTVGDEEKELGGLY